jgi:hypothetical protein
MRPAAPRECGPCIVRLLLPAFLGGLSGHLVAGPEENVEDGVNEALTRPTEAARKGNWIVVPIPVANPTVGNGLQITALYLHPKQPGEESAPGATSGVVVMATDGGARLAGIFHDSSHANDRYRLNGFVGAGKFDLKFYGIGADAPLRDNPLPYEMSGAIARLRGEVRIPGTESWFAGLTYQFLQSTLTIQASQLVSGLPDLPTNFRTAALGPHVTYDTRDSNYYPTEGQYVRAGWLDYSPRWGSDFAFDKVDAFYNHYLSFGAASVLALRGRLQTASKSTPFFALPTLDMRGFSRDRYRDNNTLSLTAEWRHKFAPRWGVVAYAEAGRIGPSLTALSEGRIIKTFGAGVRWKVTAERDMNIGLDFAVSSDDRSVFIQIGEKF